jgi:hypothetical protein
MDLGMPNKDGFDASAEILGIQRNNECSIIALTSFTDKLSHDRCIQIGMKEVTNKPVKMNEVEKLILKYHF